MNDQTPSSQPALRHLTTQDLHIRGTTVMPTPRVIEREFPMSDAAAETVLRARDGIKQILLGQDPRMLVIIGPCSIHDDAAAIEYAQRLNELRQKYADTLLIVMRVYFEKPRTTLGWKGLIYDPHLNDTFDIPAGLRRARKLLTAVSEMGLPAATEFLDPIVPQYTADLVSWAAIGARTTESQTHRQMASGLSMPVGFKNSTEGILQVAINAMLSARMPNTFLGVDHDGRTAIIQTTGNKWCHLILRGGGGMTNFEPQDVQTAVDKLTAADLSPSIMVDCSHANSGKKHEGQAPVWHSVIEQRASGNQHLVGLMLESNLREGNQKLGDDPTALEYGVSITDACVGWRATADLLAAADDALRA